MSQQYLSEVRIFSFNFPPKGWALCNGQIMSIAQNQALFALLGTMYGGNGVQTFALPNLQGRVPMHLGQNYPQGTVAGSEMHTLTLSEMPSHTHPAFATAAAGDTTSPAGNFLASGSAFYAANPSNSVSLSDPTVSTVGGGQAHENRQPYLVLNVCIALVGIFPSRN